MKHAVKITMTGVRAFNEDDAIEAAWDSLTPNCRKLFRGLHEDGLLSELAYQTASTTSVTKDPEPGTWTVAFRAVWDVAWPHEPKAS